MARASVAGYTALPSFCDGSRVTLPILFAVLGAALLHATWNALVKSAGDKFMTSARVCLW